MAGSLRLHMGITPSTRRSRVCPSRWRHWTTQACADLEKKVSQREDLVKEEDKRLQEVLDKARRFTKKLLDDEDYRPPNDEIKRFKNEDAVPSRRLHLTMSVSMEPSTRVASAMASATSGRRRRRAIDQTQVLAKINHTEKMKEQQLEKRGGKETDPEVAKQKWSAPSSPTPRRRRDVNKLSRRGSSCWEGTRTRAMID